MTHTPAPWRFNGNWLESTTSQDMILTYTNADDGLHGTDADKALISAAPDLLNALEGIMNHHASNVLFHNKPMAEKAWAAIAKARTP